MNLDAIRDLLRERIGLDTDSLGPSAVERAVECRMDALEQTRLSAYERHLRDSPVEFAALTELLVVPETWFFRGAALFEYLARHIACSLPPDRPFRVLSAPCSTGEEPFSLAIALLEGGVPRDRWSILGIDLSERALAVARAGHYRGMAFRELPATLQARHFVPEGDDWQLREAVRASVEFRVGNLLDEALFSDQPVFDLILCRNLLIYLHDQACQRVLTNLDKRLTPEGLLCLGHAEPWHLVQARFTRSGPVEFFLHQRSRTEPRAATRSEVEGPQVTPSPLMVESNGTKMERARTPNRRSPPVPPEEEAIVAPTSLADVRRLADTGAIEAALALCLELDKREQPSATRFTLEGILHVVHGDVTKARLCFRKALYLEPDHLEALEHLMVLCQQQGDQVQAQLVRRRLERARAGGET